MFDLHRAQADCSKEIVWPTVTSITGAQNLSLKMQLRSQMPPLWESRTLGRPYSILLLIVSHYVTAGIVRVCHLHPSQLLYLNFVLH